MTPESHAAHLFVPAVRPEFVSKAVASGAGAIIVDLEDSVPRERKAQAREHLPQTVASIAAHGVTACVRVNNEPDLLEEDFAAAVLAGAEVIVLPKVEDPEWVVALAARAGELQQRSGAAGEVRFELQVETARGLARVQELASAHARVASIMLGTEDFCTDLEIDPRDPDTDLSWAHGALLLAARAAGVTPYGILSHFDDFTDIEGYAAAARRSRAFGYLGAYCIHPAQVSPAVRAYAPTSAQVASAVAVVTAYAEAERQGHSAVAVEGRMVDRPVALRAERLLRRAGHQIPTPSHPSDVDTNERPIT